MEKKLKQIDKLRLQVTNKFLQVDMWMYRINTDSCNAISYPEKEDIISQLTDCYSTIFEGMDKLNNKYRIDMTNSDTVYFMYSYLIYLDSQLDSFNKLLIKAIFDKGDVD